MEFSPAQMLWQGLFLVGVVVGTYCYHFTRGKTRDEKTQEANRRRDEKLDALIEESASVRRRTGRIEDKLSSVKTPVPYGPSGQLDPEPRTGSGKKPPK